MHHTSPEAVWWDSPGREKRSRLALTLTEREEISRGIALGQSLRSIAGCLGRSPSTVSREIKRNGGPARYRAASADKRAWADRTEPAGEIRILQISWLPVSSQCAPSCGPRALRVRCPKLLNPTTRPR
jgi:DNA-binding CsgD family transcriptional regulator